MISCFDWGKVKFDKINTCQLFNFKTLDFQLFFIVFLLDGIRVGVMVHFWNRAVYYKK